jgi:hypothetical protein
VIVLGGCAWRALAVEFWILPSIPYVRAHHLASIMLRNFGVPKPRGVRVHRAPTRNAAANDQ